MSETQNVSPRLRLRKSPVNNVIQRFTESAHAKQVFKQHSDVIEQGSFGGAL